MDLRYVLFQHRLKQSHIIRFAADRGIIIRSGCLCHIVNGRSKPKPQIAAIIKLALADLRCLDRKSIESIPELIPKKSRPRRAAPQRQAPLEA